MKLKVIFCMLSILICLSGWSKTYYIPHIHTVDANWETYLIADNSRDDSNYFFTLSLFDDDGNQIYTEEHMAYAKRKTVISLRELGGVSGQLTCVNNDMVFRLGYISTSGGTAEFKLKYTLSDNPMLTASNYNTDLTWSGFAVFNGSDQPVTVTPVIHTYNFETLVQDSFTLQPKEKRVNTFDSEFGVFFNHIDQIFFSTDSDALTAITISGENNDKLLFTSDSILSDSWEGQESFERDYLFANMPAIATCTDEHFVYFLYKVYQGYGFNYVYKVFEKESGKLRASVEYPLYDVEVKGMLFSDSQNQIILYGRGRADSEDRKNVWLANIHKQTGNINWQRKDLNPANASILSIKGAVASGNSFHLIYSTSGTLQRERRDIQTGTIIDSSSANIFTIVTDAFAHNGWIYFFRTDYNETTYQDTDTMLYYCRENGLAGYAKTWDFSSEEQFGNATNVHAQGHLFIGDTLYFTLISKSGMSPSEGYSTGTTSGSQIYASSYNFSDDTTSYPELNFNINMNFFPNVNLISDSNNNVYCVVSNDLSYEPLTKIFIWDTSTYEKKPTLVKGESIVDCFSENNMVYYITHSHSYKNVLIDPLEISTVKYGRMNIEEFLSK